MRRTINGIFVIVLAGLLIFAAGQAAETRQAGWYILAGVQVAFFILAITQAIVTWSKS